MRPFRYCAFGQFQQLGLSYIGHLTCVSLSLGSRSALVSNSAAHMLKKDGLINL